MTTTDRLIIEINEKLKADFKKACDKDGRTMKYVLTNFVKDYTKEVKG